MRRARRRGVGQRQGGQRYPIEQILTDPVLYRELESEMIRQGVIE